MNFTLNLIMTENEQTSIPNGKAGLIEKIKANARQTHLETEHGIGDDARLHITTAARARS